MPRRFPHSAVAALLLAGAAAAQPDLGAALRLLTDDPRLAHAQVGVHVRDLADGKVLAHHDDDRGAMTASNMKLITAAVALLTLGPDFTFSTELHAHGTLADGVLDGDLVLRGAGDPTLGGAHETDPRAPFQRFARRLLDEHGVREITGAVLGDDDCQPDEVMGEGWAWGYHAADYAAQISGLCFAENVVRIELLPTPPGRRPGMRLWPETSYIDVTNQLLVGGDATALEVDRVLGGNQVTLRGRLAARQAHRDAVSVHNPTAFAAHVLRECLLEAGIRVRGPAADRDQWTAPLREGDQVLATHASPPLRDMLTALNKRSQNLYAEQVLRAAARFATGKAHMRDAAAHATAVLGRLGIDTEGLVLADGSGLSRLDLVQPRQFAHLLEALWHSEHRDLWLATLPVAGVDGTLADRLRNGPAHGRVRAKTGYISRVVALSGYVPRPDRAAPPLVFSVLLNDFTCATRTAKDLVDGFVQEVARAAGW